MNDEQREESRLDKMSVACEAWLVSALPYSTITRYDRAITLSAWMAATEAAEKEHAKEVRILKSEIEVAWLAAKKFEANRDEWKAKAEGACPRDCSTPNGGEA